MDRENEGRRERAPKTAVGRIGGCLGRLAVALAVISVIGFCAGSVGLVLALRSETGQAAIVSWALVEGHDGVVIGLSDRLIETSPDDWQHYRRLALSLRRLGRHDESLAVYDAAIRAMPDAWWPHSHHCFYGALYGDPHIALDHCDQAIELGPDNLEIAYFRRALAKALIDDLPGAEADLKAALGAIGPEEGRGQRAEERATELRTWLDALEAGRNPFDSATLAELRVRYFGPPDRPETGE